MARKSANLLPEWSGSHSRGLTARRETLTQSDEHQQNEAQLQIATQQEM